MQIPELIKMLQFRNPSPQYIKKGLVQSNLFAELIIINYNSV